MTSLFLRRLKTPLLFLAAVLTVALAVPLPAAEILTPPAPDTPRINGAKIFGVRLRYRHVNQAEIWQMIEMERAGDDYRAVIAAVYTDSPFPLQYHFQIHASDGIVRLDPGLQPGWHGQPYFIVRQA